MQATLPRPDYADAIRSRAGALAWSVAGLLLLLTSTQLDFVTAVKFGQTSASRMFTGVAALGGQGHGLLAALVAFCGIFAPFAVLAGIAWVAARPANRAPTRLRGFVRRIEPWSMPEVRLLAIIVALVKLASDVAAQSASGLWCYGGAAICALVAGRALGLNRSPTNPPWLRGSAAASACGIGALLLLVPAYTLPIMSFTQLGRVQTDTIFSGVLALWRGGFWVLAAIVFTASLLVPLLKLAGVAVLVATRRRGPPMARHHERLHRVVHGIGRWSMLDVFLVAFLCGIVRFGHVAAVQAHSGVLAFAGAVVLTMLATAALDGIDESPSSFPTLPAHD